MIKSIKLLSGQTSKNCDFTKVHNHKIELDHQEFNLESYTFQIEFNNAIVSFRNHDYQWVNIDQRRIANWYAPKLIKLKNNQLVQANQNDGIWEVNTQNSNILLWHFNPENSNPIANYDLNNSKHITQANIEPNIKNPLAFLFPINFAIEISRSKIPFSAIACFTDHCDFDTLDSLIQQRHFFKKYDIRLTKGFFLNHFSKRKDTASCEFHKHELLEWLNDEHELAYHSLSQSIKPDDESLQDFLNFEPPFKDVSTWIDHGFQPYNFTLSNCREDIKKEYGSILNNKGVKQLWNYIDSGTAVNGVINQLNPNQFNLKTYYKGIKHLGFKTVFTLMVKNVIFHYYNNDEALSLYKQIARYLKIIKRKKSTKKHFIFVVNLFKLVALLFPILVLWKFKKNRTYPLAEFTPLLFSHNMNGETFTVFQTLVMTDFKKALNKHNLDLLIKESGLFIAHTYFSAPMNYHQGKLFRNKNKIDTEVEKRFIYMSELIQSKKIWNPTLSELVDHLEILRQTSYDCNKNGEIYIANSNTLVSRKVK